MTAVGHTHYLKHNIDSIEFKLDDEFIDQFKGQKPKFGFNGLGEFVFYRTYSRLKADGSKEDFIDCARRVVEGCYEIQRRHCRQCHTPWDFDKAHASACEMFMRMWDFKFLPPGRGLWMMGTKFMWERGGACANNCGYISTCDVDDDPAKPFCFLMDMEMLGVGVGFDTKGANKLLITEPGGQKYIHIIDDSREGWVDALRNLIYSYTGYGDGISQFDYSKIRPAGSPINGFGGTASGPGVLKNLLESIDELLEDKIGSYLSSVDIVDLMNLIGKMVVAGNVRRCLAKGTIIETDRGLFPIEAVVVGDRVLTSKGFFRVSENIYQGRQELLIIVTDVGELRCTAKHQVAVSNGEGYYWKLAGNLSINDKLVSVERRCDVNIRMIINSGICEDTYDLSVPEVNEFVANGLLVHNSSELVLGEPDDQAYVTMKDPEKYSKEMISHRWASNNSLFATVGMNYDSIAKQIAKNGEPGLFWLDTVRKYGRLKDPGDYKDRLVAGTNPCSEQSLESGELCCLCEVFPANHDDVEDYWRTLKFAYLYAKCVTLLPTHNPDTNAVMLRNRRIGLSHSGIMQAFHKFGRRKVLYDFCDEGYKVVCDWDRIYSRWLCVSQSIKKTSVKPSGSISLLAHATPGIHYPQSTCYWRRVRVSKNSPLLRPLLDAGYHIEQAVTDPETVVVKFGVILDGLRTEEDVSIWEQTANVVDYQRYWADNQVSCTIKFKPEEADQIKQVLEVYEDQLKSISFLPLENHGYAQPPYETATREEIEAYNASLKPLDFHQISQDAVGSKFCDGDQCGI